MSGHYLGYCTELMSYLQCKINRGRHQSYTADKPVVTIICMDECRGGKVKNINGTHEMSVFVFRWEFEKKQTNFVSNYAWPLTVYPIPGRDGCFDTSNTSTSDPGVLVAMMYGF